MKNVVIIGGGTGLSVMLRGMKTIPGVELSAIVTVADDGGSTGRLRDSYQIPAMGDIRNVMCAMAEEESIFTELMNYRFKGVGDIGGHNLGNLLLLALSETTGSFMEAIRTFSRVLKVRGKILPSTLEVVTLYAVMEDGTIVRGEKNIPKFRNHIDRVFYQRHIRATEEALQAIRSADLIIYGIGSLYTSIMPNLIIDEIRNELIANPCRKVYFCNAMSQPGETDGYSVEDHVPPRICGCRGYRRQAEQYIFAGDIGTLPGRGQRTGGAERKPAPVYGAGTGSDAGGKPADPP